MRALPLLLILAALSGAAQAEQVAVTGVGADDFLRLRAGPGTGYRVIVGLPEGTKLQRRSCDRVGGTLWCQVSLAEVPRLRGYVANHYLQPAP